MKMGTRAGRVLAIVLLLLAVLVGSTCEDPTGAQLDITGISTTVNGHFHRCTIPGRDITIAAPGDHSYTSTPAGTDGHQHVVTLTQQQLLDLQQPNSSANVASGPGGADSHTHSFLFEH